MVDASVFLADAASFGVVDFENGKPGASPTRF
jgi:hypothetical protein